MAQIKTPDLGSVYNIVDVIPYCHKLGMEASQGGIYNEADVSAHICIPIAIAARPMRGLIKPGLVLSEISMFMVPSNIQHCLT